MPGWVHLSFTERDRRPSSSSVRRETEEEAGPRLRPAGAALRRRAAVEERQGTRAHPRRGSQRPDACCGGLATTAGGSTAGASAGACCSGGTDEKRSPGCAVRGGEGSSVVGWGGEGPEVRERRRRSFARPAMMAAPFSATARLRWLGLRQRMLGVARHCSGGREKVAPAAAAAARARRPSMAARPCASSKARARALRASEGGRE
jgi:hypothetical protein